MLAWLDTALLPHRTLTDLYRFAWLMTGAAATAEQALATALTGAERHLEDLRTAGRRHAWLLQRLRQACLALAPARGDEEPSAPRLLREETLETPEILEIEAYIVARFFQAVPEPDRSALALFYLDLLTPAESARLLGLPLEEYCTALGRARHRLHETIHATAT